jgi:hypothetical protein
MPAASSRRANRPPRPAAARSGVKFLCSNVRNELAQPLHIASFVNREVIDACVLRGMFKRPRSARLTYVGFVDPSGGSVDSFTCAIAHCDHVRHVVLIDAIREIKAPFSPEAAVSELATLLRSYRVYKVHGDKYAGEWPRESFAKLGISYEPSPQPKSGLYSAFLPLLNSGASSCPTIRASCHSFAAWREKRHAGGGIPSITQAVGAMTSRMRLPGRRP